MTQGRIWHTLQPNWSTLTILVHCSFTPLLWPPCTRLIYVSTLGVFIRPQWSVVYPQRFYNFTMQVNLACPLGILIKICICVLINNSEYAWPTVTQIVMPFWVSQTICFRMLTLFSRKCWLFWYDSAQNTLNFGLGCSSALNNYTKKKEEEKEKEKKKKRKTWYIFYGKASVILVLFCPDQFHLHIYKTNKKTKQNKSKNKNKKQYPIHYLVNTSFLQCT